MEKLMNNNHESSKKPYKPNSNKKKPIKVVYFTNPMRVTATPSEFRDVVQRFTGQDSDAAEWSDFQSTAADSTGAPIDVEILLGRHKPDPGEDQDATGHGETFAMLEDFMPPEMFEDLVGRSYSALCYEP